MFVPIPHDLLILRVGIHKVGRRHLGRRDPDHEVHRPAEQQRSRNADHAPPLKKNGDGHHGGNAQARQNTERNAQNFHEKIPLRSILPSLL